MRNPSKESYGPEQEMHVPLSVGLIISPLLDIAIWVLDRAGTARVRTVPWASAVT